MPRQVLNLRGVGAIREIDTKVSMAGEQGPLQYFARFLALGVA